MPLRNSLLSTLASIDAHCCLVSGARTVRTPALKKALLLTVLVMAAAPALAEDAQPAQAAEPRQAENQGETRTETNGTMVASPSSAPEAMCDTLAAAAARHDAPMMQHRVQTMREPKVGTGT